MSLIKMPVMAWVKSHGLFSGVGYVYKNIINVKKFADILKNWWENKEKLHYLDGKKQLSQEKKWEI